DPAVDRAVVEVALAVRSRDDFRVDDIAPGGLARPRLPGLRAGDVCTGVGPGPGRGRRGRDPDGTPALVVADVDDERVVEEVAAAEVLDVGRPVHPDGIITVPVVLRLGLVGEDVAHVLPFGEVA